MILEILDHRTEFELPILSYTDLGKDDKVSIVVKGENIFLAEKLFRLCFITTDIGWSKVNETILTFKRPTKFYIHQ